MFMKYSYIFLLFAFALSTTGSIAQGNCSTVDLEYICQNTEYVQSIAFQCGIDCMAEEADCLEQCMLDALALSTPCIGCFGEQVICIVQNCSTACFSGTEAECAECALQNCEANFNVCAGIVDEDNDTWTNLCDCDDSNPVVYPGADGTSQGLDNDCNGLITNDELTTCSADINGDNITGTSDLLHFLSLFNCVGDCADLETGDFSGDGVVGTADLLILLSEFGLYCH